MSTQFDQLVKKHTLLIAGRMALAQAEIEAGLRPEEALVQVFEEGLRAFAKDAFDLPEEGQEG